MADAPGDDDPEAMHLVYQAGWIDACGTAADFTELVSKAVLTDDKLSMSADQRTAAQAALVSLAKTFRGWVDLATATEADANG